jgi:CubicO group peptidase (beta-lactamase class C family)
MGHAARQAIACIYVMLAAAPLAAQQPAPARVDSLFAGFDRKDSPGCALGVYQDGRIVYARGYGMADIANGIAITPQTIFDIGSTSKQFTATAIVLLAQQGKLSLDDDVRRFIPELPQYSKPITIRQLLHHTSGLRDYIALLLWGGASVEGHTTAQQALAAIARQKGLNFEPGAEQLYSNSGYFLLSQIVERASGKTLRVFAQQHIFDPLGMSSTHFHDDHQMVVPGRALGYERGNTGFDIAMSNWEQTGDGAVYTNIEDLLHWDQNFYQPRIGGAQLVQTLLTRGRLSNGDTLDYALGLVHDDYRGLPSISHGGAWAGYRAELIRFPQQKLSVATLCNLASADPSGLARAVASLYLADRMTAPAVAKAATDAERVSVAPTKLSSWAANYRNPVTGTPRVVTFENGKLMASFGPQRAEMVPTAENEFTVIVEPNVLRLVLERAGDGPRRMRQFSNGREMAVFEEVQPVEPDPVAVQRHAGEYFSEELQTTFRVSAEGSTLILHRAAEVPIKFNALSNGLFVSGPWSLQFTRNGQGEITGFVMGAGRVRGIVFTRK